jgi:hypothetical protein
VVLFALKQSGGGVVLVIPSFIIALASSESAITGVGPSITSGFGVVSSTLDPFGLAISSVSLQRAIMVVMGLCVSGVVSWLAAGSSPTPSAIEDDHDDDDREGFSHVLVVIKRVIGTLLIVVGLSVSQSTIWTVVMCYTVLFVLSLVASCT